MPMFYSVLLKSSEDANAVYDTAEVQYGLMYAACPNCDNLVPVDSLLVDTGCFGLTYTTLALFGCKCGATWAVLFGEKREDEEE